MRSDYSPSLTQQNLSDAPASQLNLFKSLADEGLTIRIGGKVHEVDSIIDC